MTENLSIYRMTGSIDASNAKQVQEDLLAFIRGVSSSAIIVDFRDVEFLDSAGLMALVAGYKEAKNQICNFMITGVSPSVRIIFEVSQLDQILGVRDSLNTDSLNRELIAA